MRRRFGPATFAILIAAAWTIPSAQATNGTWTKNIATDSDWNTSSNWLGGVIADGAGAVANFSTINLDQATTQGVVIDGAVKSITVGTFLFGDNVSTPKTYLIKASNGGTLTFDNNGANALLTGVNVGGINLSAPVILEDNLVASVTNVGPLAISGNITSGTVRAGQKNITLSANGTTSAATITLSGGVNHSGSILNNGAGAGATTISGAIGANVTGITQNSATSALTLSGVNTAYAGPTTLTAGTLKLGSATALGGNGSTTGTGGALTIAADTVLDASAATTLTTINAQNWNGNFAFGGSFALNTGTGAISLGAANLTLTNSGASTLTVGGGVTGTSNLTLNTTAAGGVTFSGLVNSTGTITNSGTGAGTTTISGGVGSNVTSLTQNSTTSALTISGLLTVNSGGTTLTNASGTKLLTVSGGTAGNGDLILKNDSVTANGITLSTNAINHTGTITNSGGGNGSTLISAVIGANVTGITQNSATSALVLTGANLFTGPVTLTAGTLSVSGNATALGTGAATLILNGGTLDFNNSATLNFDRNTTVGGNVAIISERNAAGGGLDYTLGTLSIGANTLNVSGGNITSGTAGLIFGATTLTGNTSFNVTNPVGGGTTRLTLGALDDGGVTARAILKSGNGSMTINAAATSLIDGTTVNITGGTLNSTNATALGSLAAVTVSSGATFGSGATQQIGSLAGSGTLNITLGTTLTVGNNANNLTGTTFSGNTAATTGILRKSGSGTWTLTGTNLHTGGTALLNGTLYVQNVQGLGNGGNLTLSGGTLDLQTDTSVNSQNTVIGGSGGTIVSDRLTAGAGITHTLGTLSISAQTLSLTKGANVTSGTAGLTFGTTSLSVAAAVFDPGAGTNLTLGSIGGNLAFTKQGAGQLTLNTASTRNGSTAQTTLNGGTLRLGALNALSLGANFAFNFTSGTLSVGVDTGGTVLGTAIVVGANTANLELDRATAGAGVSYSFNSLSIGAGQLNVTAGSNVTSGISSATFGATTLTGGPAVIDTAANTNLTLGAIGGAFAFTKQGAGQLTLNTASSRTTTAGTTTLSAGTLRLGTQSALNTYTGATPVLFLNGGILSLALDAATTVNGTAMTVGGNATIEVDRATAGAGVTDTLRGVSIGGGYTLTVMAGSNVTSGTAGLNAGATTLTGASTFSLGSGTKLTIAAMTNDSNTATFTGAGDVAQSGIWGGGTGTGGITFDSGFSGSAVLNQANTFASGSAITLNGGTIYLNNNAALGSALLSLGGGVMIDNATSSVYTFASGYTQQWTGNWTFGGTTNSLVFSNSGAIALTANVQITLDGTRNLTEGGTITGAHDLTLNTIGTGQFVIPATVNNTGKFTITGTAGQLANISGAIGSNVSDVTNTSTGGVTLSNAIGNTGKLINQGTGAGAFTASGVIADTVTDIIQDSSLSNMVVSGVNNGAGGFATGTGTVTIKNGTFQSGPASSLGAGNVVSIGTGGTFDFNTNNIAIGGLSDTTGNGVGVATVTNSTNIRTLTLGNSNNYSFSGRIIQGAAVAAITKTGSGTQTLSGDHTYTGNTSVNLGTLALTNNGTTGSMGGTAINVASPSTNNSGAAPVAGVSGNATLQVNGNYTIGTSTLGRLNIAGGDGVSFSQGTLSLVDGTVNTLTLANDTTVGTLPAGQTFSFGGASAVKALLNIEVGAAGSDKIVVGSGTAKMFVGNGGGLVNLTGLGGLTGTQQTVIDVAGGVAAGNLANITLGTTSGNFGGYQVAIGNTATSVFLTETANAAAANAYYNGAAALVPAQGGTTAFNSFVNGNTNTSNFGTGAGGTGNMNGQLAGTTNVFFDTNIVAPLSTSLGQDLSINSLNLNTASAVTIGGANTLMITAAAVNGNTAGNGITVASGSGNHVLNNKIALGNSQTWTVTDSGTTLTASNEISGVGKSLTKAGAGVLTLTGTSTYTGATNISVGTLIVNGSLSNASLVTVASGAKLGGNGSIGDLLVQSGGTHAPGNSPGLQTVTGNASYASGSTFAFELNKNIALTSLQPGPTYDFDQVAAGSLDITSGAVFTITLNGAGSTVDFTNSFWTSNQQWLVFGVSGAGTGNFTLGAISADSQGQGYGSYGSFDLQNLSGDIYLSWNAAVIPEPSSASLLLIGSGVGFLLFRRRRRVA